MGNSSAGGTRERMAAIWEGWSNRLSRGHFIFTDNVIESEGVLGGSVSIWHCSSMKGMDQLRVIHVSDHICFKIEILVRTQD